MRDSIARFLYCRPLAIPANPPAARDHRELELTDRRLLWWWALLLLFYFTRGRDHRELELTDRRLLLWWALLLLFYLMLGALEDDGVRAAPLVVVVVSLRKVEVGSK